MRELTPEIELISEFVSLGAGATILETRTLDFNLARQTAVVINELVGEMHLTMQAALGVASGIQEIDMDPDNVDIWNSAWIYDGYEMDSSRIFRHGIGGQIDPTATSSFAFTTGAGLKRKDYRNLSLDRRPISLTNMRHHVENACGARTDNLDTRMMIAYQIVELSEAEVGYLYARRR